MTRRLWPLVGLVAALGLLPMLALPEPRGESALTHSFGFLRGESHQDSWGPMLGALEHADSRGADPIYAALFFERHVKFQYPLTSLPPFAAARRVAAWLDVPLYDLMHGASWLCALATVLLTAAVARSSLRRAGVADAGAAAAVAACATLLFYPLMKGFTLGQVQVMLDAAFAALVACWLAGRERAAGVLLGLICLVKPHFAGVWLWGLLRGRRRFVQAALVTAALGLALAVATYGLLENVLYLEVAGYLARHGESYHANQSVNGIAQRLFQNGEALEWTSDAFPPFHGGVFAATLANAALVLGAALFGPTHPSQRGGPVDLGVAALATTMASPIAWEHHYGILPPVYAVLLPPLHRAGGWAAALAAASFVLTGTYFAELQRWSSWAGGMALSLLLLGALLLFGIACWVRARPTGDRAPR